ncbi:MAG: hypothetical protein ACREB2_04890 [Pseudolabrys sp.]
MDKKQFDEFLDATLKRHGKMPPSDHAAVERVLQRLNGPLPQQKMPWWQLPNVLLDWQFAPAWPRVAALAGFAALGFVIGITGLDRRVEPADAGFTVASSSDLGSIVFEPEALTGARP